MINFNYIKSLHLIGFIVASTMVWAQEVSKEVVIVKEIVDENGNKTTEEIKLTGEEAEKYINEHEVEMMEGNVEKEVEVRKWIDDEGKEYEVTDEKVIKFINNEIDSEEFINIIEKEGESIKVIEKENTEHYKIVTMDDDGQKKILEWDGAGEMPEEMKAIMNDQEVHEMLEKIEVDVEKEQNEPTEKKIIKIKTKKNGKEEIELIELDGDEEIPADIQKMLKEKGVDLEDLEKIQGDDSIKQKKIRIEKTIEEKVEKDIEKEIQIQMQSPNHVEIGIVIEEINNAVVILDVVSKGPADQAGIIQDDQILSINGTEVKNVKHVAELIGTLKIGDNAVLHILRDGKELTKEMETIKNESEFKFSDTNLLKTKKEREADENGNLLLNLIKC